MPNKVISQDCVRRGAFCMQDKKLKFNDNRVTWYSKIPIYRKPRFTAPQSFPPIFRNCPNIPVYEHVILSELIWLSDWILDIIQSSNAYQITYIRTISDLIRVNHENRQSYKKYEEKDIFVENFITLFSSLAVIDHCGVRKPPTRFFYRHTFLLVVIGHRGVRKPPEWLKIIKAEYKRTELMIPQNWNKIVTIIILCNFCDHFCRLGGVVVTTIASQAEGLGFKPSWKQVVQSPSS